MRGGLRQRSQSGQNVSFIPVERILNTFIKWKKIRISNTIQKLFKRGARTFQSNWLRIPSPCIAACFSGDKWELQSLWNSFFISNSIQSWVSGHSRDMMEFPLGIWSSFCLGKIKVNKLKELKCLKKSIINSPHKDYLQCKRRRGKWV